MAEPGKKSSFLKWVGVIAIVVVLALISIVFAVVISLISGIYSLSHSGAGSTGSGNVALIYVSGIITTDSRPSPFDSSTMVSSSDIVEEIEKLRDDDTVKAVMFEINSPGGSGVAADEISQAIRSLRSYNKTTVAYIRDIGASAAYWIASSSDYVLANRLSIVGSIGVIGSYLDFSGLLKRYNITYERFVAGKYKDFGSPFRTPSAEERSRFQSQLDAMQSVFIADVAQNRNMSVQNVTSLADGFIFTGIEAKDNGLIDAIGGKQEAISFIEKKLNITADVRVVERKSSIFDLLGLISERSSYDIGLGIGDSLKKAQAEGLPQPLLG